MIVTATRLSTFDEVVAEMDRRGAVIERLEAQIESMRQEHAVALSEARAQERERATKIADEKAATRGDDKFAEGARWAAFYIAEAIRAHSPSHGEGK